MDKKDVKRLAEIECLIREATQIIRKYTKPEEVTIKSPDVAPESVSITLDELKAKVVEFVSKDRINNEQKIITCIKDLGAEKLSDLDGANREALLLEIELKDNDAAQ